MWRYGLEVRMATAATVGGVLTAAVAVAGCPAADNPARSAIDATPASPAAPGVVVASTAAEVWSCPMHPEVVQDHAGTCLKCGMDLVKKGP